MKNSLPTQQLAENPGEEIAPGVTAWQAAEDLAGRPVHVPPAEAIPALTERIHLLTLELSGLIHQADTAQGRAFRDYLHMIATCRTELADARNQLAAANLQLQSKN
jgi:hypothetical protein